MAQPLVSAAAVHSNLASAAAAAVSQITRAHCIGPAKGDRLYSAGAFRVEVANETPDSDLVFFNNGERMAVRYAKVCYSIAVEERAANGERKSRTPIGWQVSFSLRSADDGDIELYKLTHGFDGSQSGGFTGSAPELLRFYNTLESAITALPMFACAYMPAPVEVLKRVN